MGGEPAQAARLVAVDQAAGAVAATRHLSSAGHRTVRHLAGPARCAHSEPRRRGWQSALESAGAEVPHCLEAEDWTADAGYRTGRLLARMPEVTAVFATHDHLALGLLRALHEHGRRVPEEVGVVGFGDVPEAAHLIPSLTTVRPDLDAVAREGMTAVLEAVAGHPPAGSQRTVLPRLVVRGSVAPLPPAEGQSPTATGRSGSALYRDHEPG